jgi:hypothetical protein
MMLNVPLAQFQPTLLALKVGIDLMIAANKSSLMLNQNLPHLVWLPTSGFNFDIE